MAAHKAWALITGASSGIGKALAFEFAARGYNLFLVARNGQALSQVGAECSQQSGVETKIFPVDLSDPSALDGLIRTLGSPPLDFEILVNNAGFGLHGEFHATDINKESQLVNVQLAAMLKLTKAVLSGMMARKNGRILNVASVYSFSPVPFQSVYSASKAFMLSFSESLGEELKGTGVTVTTLCPGTTKSEFRARAGISHKDGDAGVPAESVAKVAVRGTLRGKHLIVPGLTNRFFVFMSRHLPVRLVPRLLRSINKARGVND